MPVETDKRELDVTWRQGMACVLVGGVVVGALTAATGGLAMLSGGSALTGSLYGAGFTLTGSGAGYACACAFTFGGKDEF